MGLLARVYQKNVWEGCAIARGMSAFLSAPLVSSSSRAMRRLQTSLNFSSVCFCALELFLKDGEEGAQPFSKGSHKYIFGMAGNALLLRTARRNWVSFSVTFRLIRMYTIFTSKRQIEHPSKRS